MSPRREITLWVASANILGESSTAIISQLFRRNGHQFRWRWTFTWVMLPVLSKGCPRSRAEWVQEKPTEDSASISYPERSLVHNDHRQMLYRRQLLFQRRADSSPRKTRTQGHTWSFGSKPSPKNTRKLNEDPSTRGKLSFSSLWVKLKLPYGYLGRVLCCAMTLEIFRLK